MGGMETELPKNALPHWELAKKYDLIDFDLGVKITGAGFPVYKGKGARLQRALINFFLDEARASGYEEIMPPTVVNTASGFGTGLLHGPTFPDVTVWYVRVCQCVPVLLLRIRANGSTHVRLCRKIRLHDGNIEYMRNS